VQSCYIPKSAVSGRGLYHTFSGEIKWTENLPEEHGDARLVLEKGRWFVCLPVEEQHHKPENQGRVVSLDPGIRSFLSFFSETSCGKLGKHDFGKIQRLCSHLDKLQSQISKAAHKQSQRLKKAAQRIRWRIKDLVSELHHKSAKFLVDNFDVILLPTFETKNMARRTKRKIGSKSVRAMLTWAHFRFKLFLKHKAFEYGKTVVDCNEAYTSKTVSWTGEIQNIGGAKQITSKLDGQTMDRDYNGARGIFLRALVDSPSLRCNYA
jgi:putative transposase